MVCSMCPEYQILSVYADGELPSPWKEKLETHLNSCPNCRERLNRLKMTSQVLRSAMLSPQLVSQAEERVWQNIHSDSGRQRKYIKTYIWERNISLPIPAVAAAAAMLLFFTFAFVLFRQPVTQPQTAQGYEMVVAEVVDVQSTFPFSNMNDVLQYLGNQDNSDVVFIRLPDNKSFSSFGEPTIINAADYYSQRGENNNRRTNNHGTEPRRINSGGP